MREYAKKQNLNCEKSPEKSAPQQYSNPLKNVLEGRMRATDEMKGHRQDLAPSMEAKMSAVFGMDFSNLRVYRSNLLEQEGEKGISSGNTVVLSTDLDLNTFEGQTVLGHELSHIHAQSQGIGMGNSGLYRNSSLEEMADHEGILAAQGRSLTDESTGMKETPGMRSIGGLTPIGTGMSISAGAPMQAWGKGKKEDPFKYIKPEKRKKKTDPKAEEKRIFDEGYEGDVDEDEKRHKAVKWTSGFDDKPINQYNTIDEMKETAKDTQNPSQSFWDAYKGAYPGGNPPEGFIKCKKGPDSPEYSIKGLYPNRIACTMNSELFNDMDQEEKLGFLHDLQSGDYDRVVKSLGKYRWLCYSHLKEMKKNYGTELTKLKPSEIGDRLGYKRYLNDTFFLQDAGQMEGDGDKKQEDFFDAIKSGFSKEENDEYNMLREYYGKALRAGYNDKMDKMGLEVYRDIFNEDRMQNEIKHIEDASESNLEKARSIEHLIDWY